MKKAKFVDSDYSVAIANLAKATDKKILARWAADCAEKVLPYFTDQNFRDGRPRKAIAAARFWSEGDISLGVAQKASIVALAAARSAEDGAPRAAARAAGQAAATAKSESHAIQAATFAAKAIFYAEPEQAEAKVDKHRFWQYRHLVDLGPRVL